MMSILLLLLIKGFKMWLDFEANYGGRVIGIISRLVVSHGRDCRCRAVPQLCL